MWKPRYASISRFSCTSPCTYVCTWHSYSAHISTHKNTFKIETLLWKQLLIRLFTWYLSNKVPHRVLRTYAHMYSTYVRWGKSLRSYQTVSYCFLLLHCTVLTYAAAFVHWRLLSLPPFGYNQHAQSYWMCNQLREVGPMTQYRLPIKSTGMKERRKVIPWLCW